MKAMTITLKHTDKAKQNRAAQQQVQEPAISQKAVLAVLSIKRWQGIKRDAKTTAAITEAYDANEKAGWFDKQIVSKQFLKELSVIVSRARVLHKTMTLPWTDDGIRILPSKKLNIYINGIIKTDPETGKRIVVQEGMNHLEKQYEAALDRLLAAYEDEKKAQQELILGLGRLWNEADYPTKEALKERHGWSLRFMPLPTSMDFRVNVGQEAEAALKKQMKAQLSLVEKKASQEVARRIAAHMERIIERLSAEKVRINDSLTGSLTDMMEDLDELNVFENGQVADFIKRLKPLADTDPQMLRDSELARVGTKQVAKDLMVDLTAFMA